MTISIIIVNYNVKYYLEQCLDSLLRATSGIDAEIIVVDNNSKDGSVEHLRSRFPHVKYICSDHNNGFACANNIAIRQCKGKYVLLLNPDTFVGEYTLKSCLHFMDEHPQAGGVGVRMLKEDGSDALESRRGLPTPLTAFYKMCGLCAKFPQSERFGKYYMGYLPWDKPAQIEVISGAFLLTRKVVFDKIGLLDEDFFMYGEDIDLSYRILSAGYQNWYLPYPILHYKGESTQKSSFRYVHVFYGAMLIFFKKHYSHLSLWISFPIKTAVFFKALTALLSMQVSGLKKSLGFVSTHRQTPPRYIFVLKEKNLHVCQQLMAKRGIDATYTIGDEQSLPNGYDVSGLNSHDTYYIVYDVEAYSYQSVLSIFAKHIRDNIMMAMFHPQSNMVITGKDILL